MSALAEAIRAQARALELVADALDAERREEPAHYSAAHLPPGAASWRAARETAAREGIATVRVGRSVLIDRAAWDGWFARLSRTRAPVAIEPSDERALEAMGLRLVGGRR